MDTLQMWVAISTLVSNLIFGGIVALFSVKQWSLAKKLKAEHVEYLTNEIMLSSCYYIKYIDTGLYGIAQKPIPLAERNIPAIHGRIKRRLMEEVS
jgi:hypothetical protein